eukprot:gene11212-biopygen13117
MSTRGRSRKKTASKTPARLTQHALSTDDRHHEASLELFQVSTSSAPASSPIVRLATRAMSPLCAAVAKAAAGVVAVTLPTIPETSTVTSHNLDDQDQRPEDEPSTPRCASPVQDDGNLLSPDNTTMQQQPHPVAVHQPVLDERHLEDAKHGKQECPATLDSVDQAGGAPPSTVSLRQQLYNLVIMRHRPSVLFCAVCVLLFLQLMMSFQSHSTISRRHQQQLSAQDARLLGLQQQLQDVQHQLQHLPHIQSKMIQSDERVSELFSAQSQLKSSVEQLAGTTQQLASNLHSMKNSLQQGHPLWQLLSAVTVQDEKQHDQQAMEAASPAKQHSSSSAADASAAQTPLQDYEQNQNKPLLQDQQQQLRSLAGSWQFIQARLLASIQQEVQQQLTKQLPAVNLAAADCGAYIAYHSPLAPPAPPQQAAASDRSLGAIKNFVAGLHQVIQAQLSQPAIRFKSIAAGTRIADNMVNTVLLRPNAQQLCVPFKAHPAATLEIQLPQPAHITSVTFHLPSAAAAGCAVHPPAPANFWCSATASQLVIAYVNSSSCSGNAGNGASSSSSKGKLCSATAASTATQQPHLGVQTDGSSARSYVPDGDGGEEQPDFSGRQLFSGAKAADDAADVVRSSNSILAHGVEGAQQQVQLEPLGVTAGSLVVPVAADPSAGHISMGSSSRTSSSYHIGRRSVLADRVVLHVSRSYQHPHQSVAVTDLADTGANGSGSQAGPGVGGGGGVVCLYRITVQAMPAGNRRPLYSEEDLVQVSQIVAEPADGPAATASLTDKSDAANVAFKQPCTFKGLASGAYAGMLGYFLGVVPAAIKFKGKQWGLVHGQGMGSAGQLALMSGMYTAVHCICQRIRMVEDGWNRGIAGCSTGLVLGWKAGPWSAVQSCVGLGLISALIDLGTGAVEAAEAAALDQLHQLQREHHMCVGVMQPHAAADVQSQLSSVGSSRQQQQLSAVSAYVLGPVATRRDAQHKQQQQQHLLMQPLQLLQPAVDVVQQIVHAPPLSFLGACCNGSLNASLVAAADVDACEVLSAGTPHPRQRK